MPSYEYLIYNRAGKLVAVVYYEDVARRLAAENGVFSYFKRKL